MLAFQIHRHSRLARGQKPACALCSAASPLYRIYYADWQALAASRHTAAFVRRGLLGLAWHAATITTDRRGRQGGYFWKPVDESECAEGVKTRGIPSQRWMARDGKIKRRQEKRTVAAQRGKIGARGGGRENGRVRGTRALEKREIWGGWPGGVKRGSAKRAPAMRIYPYIHGFSRDSSAKMSTGRGDARKRKTEAMREMQADARGRSKAGLASRKRKLK